MVRGIRLDEPGDDGDPVTRREGPERRGRRVVRELGGGENVRPDRVALDEALREDDEVGAAARRPAKISARESDVRCHVADPRPDLGDSDP